LWDRCPAATPFQSPEWLLPWWRRLGWGRLWALALRREGRLCGLAPLFLGRYYGLPLRAVRLLGTGISDSLDLLLEPEHAREGAAAILDHLARCRRAWDLADFRQLPPDSPLAAAPIPSSIFSRGEADEVCPVLSL